MGSCAQVVATYISNAPAGLNGSTLVGTCNASTVDLVSGVGDCALELDGKYFPASGAAMVDITLRVLQG